MAVQMGMQRATAVISIVVFGLLAAVAGAAPAAVVFAAASTGLVIVALQIAYLPTLYAAFVPISGPPRVRLSDIPFGW